MSTLVPSCSNWPGWTVTSSRLDLAKTGPGQRGARRRRCDAMSVEPGGRIRVELRRG